MSKDVPSMLPHMQTELEMLEASAKATRDTCGPVNMAVAMRQIQHAFLNRETGPAQVSKVVSFFLFFLRCLVK